VKPGDDTLSALVAYIPREISIALLIAAVLNVVVERTTQRRHGDLELRVQERLRLSAEQLNEQAHRNAERLNRQVRKNVLRAVFKENLGDKVVRQIEAKLFERKPYRLKADVTYSLSLVTDSKGVTRVLIDSHLRYNVFNPSTSPELLPIVFGTTSPDEFASDCSIKDIKCGGVSILNTEIAGKCKAGGTIQYEDKAGCSLGPKESKWIEIRHQRADYLEGNETYISTLPVEELRVYVTYPEGFHVWAMALHPDDEETIGGTAVSRTWLLEGLIPGQGLAFMWRRRSGGMATVSAPTVPGT
jgi:hypothetical protein